MSQHLYAIDLSKENKHESLELLQDPNKSWIIIHLKSQKVEDLPKPDIWDLNH